MKQRIIISKSLEKDLTLAISECEHDKVFVLADETTIDKCWPVIKDFRILKNAQTIVIGATDTHKTLESLAHVWKALGDGGATRHSCLINLGGGMVTDLGGFAASTFKRGIDFINIPTTLLAMVDASVGGKTGINFNGLKNEVGVFNDAKYVILDTNFLKTLYDILLDLYRVSHHLLQLLIVGSRELEIEKLSKVSIVGDESMLKHLSIARAQVVVVESF